MGRFPASPAASCGHASKFPHVGCCGSDMPAPGPCPSGKLPALCTPIRAGSSQRGPRVSGGAQDGGEPGNLRQEAHLVTVTHRSPRKVNAEDETWREASSVSRWAPGQPLWHPWTV